MNCQSRAFILWGTLGMLPALAYSVVVSLAVLFHIDAPARFMLAHLLPVGWSIHLLFVLAIGLPLISTVGSLAIRERQVLGWLGQAVGWIGLLLVVSNVGLIPFFFVWILTID